MKKVFFSLSIFVTSVFLFTNSTNAQTNNSQSTLLKHIVIITFKQDASADSIKALDNIYKDLSESPLVKSFEMGVDISTRNNGVTKHVYATTFASKEDMMNYVKIPEHEKLFKISLPLSDDVTVVDYWINK